ncbi:MerR family DNA-binding transcriptional regulator [Paenibacillus sp. J2TS4]
MYSVGQFSRICGMSVKTLHHYDEVGLLKPCRPGNGLPLL